MGLSDKNLYAYCDNNPVMRRDDGGMFWDTVFDVVSLVCSVVDVIKNPDDPWAWAGLAADVVSLAVPFATGGGTIVKAASKVDDVVDVAKSVDKAADAIDTAMDSAKLAGKTTEEVSKVAKNGAVKNFVFIKLLTAPRYLNPSLSQTRTDGFGIASVPAVLGVLGGGIAFLR